MSYYDYYQPEAYIPADTYIKKDSSINDEIDNSPSATLALSERNDVIIVASVSCIYSLVTLLITAIWNPLRPGMEKSRDDLVKSLLSSSMSATTLFIRKNSESEEM